MTEEEDKSVPEYYLSLPYARVLVPEPNDGGYSALIKELPGCFAEGETSEEALRNLEEAAFSWIEAALHLGQPIPTPAGTHQYSGRIALRTSPSLHERVAEAASDENVSINQFIVTTLAERVGAARVATYTQQWLSETLTALAKPICASIEKSAAEATLAYAKGASAFDSFNSYLATAAFSYEPVTKDLGRRYEQTHKVDATLRFDVRNLGDIGTIEARQNDRAA